MPKAQPNRLVAALQHGLPALLRAPGIERTSKQKPRGRNAGRNLTSPAKSWPGKSFGVRAPEDGETPLSAEEVLYAQRMGLL